MDGFNPEFIASLNEAPGVGDPAALLSALDGVPEVSVRYNSGKLSADPNDDRVPWCPRGFYLPQRPSFAHDPLFHAGAYYVQEAGSMFIGHLFNQAFGGEKPKRVLDLCASPGGKTTLLSSLAGPDALVVANEAIRTRVGALAENVQKWGTGNTVVTNNDPKQFARLGLFFDLALVDAPCSGEGMFRKDRAARAEWSADNVNLCAARQRRILADVWESVAPGGVVIYSTCTFNRHENEENVRWLTENYDVGPVEIALDDSWDIVRTGVGGVDCFRFYPHKTRSEGFFAAVLRKGGEPVPGGRKYRPVKAVFSELSAKAKKEVSGWCSASQEMAFVSRGERVYGYYKAAFDDVLRVADHLNVVTSGVEMGTLIRDALKPAHPLSMFVGLNAGALPVAELPHDRALDYLAREEVPADLFAEGLNLVCYQGAPLGFVKRIGRRCNNLYPSEWRLRNR